MVLGKILEDTTIGEDNLLVLGNMLVLGIYIGTGWQYIGTGWYIRGQCSTIGGEAQPQGPPLTVSNHPMRPWTLQRSCK